MFQLRLGAAALGIATAAHVGYVVRQRASVPSSGRHLLFSPGSQDDIVSETLKTGDLVLFRRDALAYPGFAALEIVGRQARTHFDHAGVIVMQKGVPHVLERTAGGVRLRRYDARIKTSLSKEVLVRQLMVPLTKVQCSNLCTFADAASQLPAASTTPAPILSSQATALGQLLGKVADAQANDSVAFVTEAYSAAGLHMCPLALRGHMAALAPPAQPFAKEYSLERFDGQVWVRDLR